MILNFIRAKCTEKITQKISERTVNENDDFLIRYFVPRLRPNITETDVRQSYGFKKRSFVTRLSTKNSGGANSKLY